MTLGNRSLLANLSETLEWIVVTKGCSLTLLEQCIAPYNIVRIYTCNRCHTLEAYSGLDVAVPLHTLLRLQRARCNNGYIVLGKSPCQQRCDTLIAVLTDGIFLSQALAKDTEQLHRLRLPIFFVFGST